MLDKAIDFAFEAHKGICRKGSSQPYIFHPLEVLSLVSTMTQDDDILCAAVLHDTVEDTPVTLDDVRREFGDKIAGLVDMETENKRGQKNKEATWMDRKKEAIEALRERASLGSKMVALADKVSNLRSFHMGLLKQGDEFWNLFNQKNPLMHYWYFNELKDALSDLKEEPLYMEFCFLIDAVFSKYLKEGE